MAHPLMKGFLLAVTLTAALTLGAAVNLNPGDPVQAGAMVLGALIAAIPGRVMRRRHPRPTLSWQRCLAGFLGGFGTMLGAGLASGGIFFHGLMAAGAGAVSSAAFIAVMLTVAMICAWARRRELT